MTLMKRPQSSSISNYNNNKIKTHSTLVDFLDNAIASEDLLSIMHSMLIPKMVIPQRMKFIQLRANSNLP